VALPRFPDLRAALLGLLVVAPVAANDGGYWPSTWSWTALALFWGTAVALVLRRAPRLRRLELAFLACTIMLFGWFLLSGLWSSSTPRTVLESQRALVYVAGAFAALLLVQSQSYRALLGGVWVGVTLVCSYSLLTRLFPDRLLTFDPIASYRLSEPVGYWNALGIFAAIGALLALGFATRGRSILIRTLAGGSTTILVLTLYFTFSRGAWIALGAGLLGAAALDLRRLQLSTALLVISPWPAAAVWIASRSEGLTRSDAPLQMAAEDGRRMAVIVAGLVVGGALAALALAVMERRLPVPRRIRLAWGGLLAAALIAVLTAVFVRYGSPPTLVGKAYDAFRAPPRQVGQDLNARLFVLSGTGRISQWRVAWRDYRDHAWLGSGAGTYEQAWLRHRPVAGRVRDAHSLYLEVLAEVGPVGLTLLAALLGIPLVAAMRVRRRELVPLAGGAYLTYVVHAGIDWDWEMTGVTLTALFCGCALLTASRVRGAKLLSKHVRGGAVTVVLALASFALVGAVGSSALESARKAWLAAEPVKAEEHARKAIRWAPWSSEAWLLLARAQFARDKPTAGRASLRKAIAKDPRDWVLWYELALESSARAQRKWIARASELNPLSPELRQLRAELGVDESSSTSVP
jgi:hypothetical protein